MQGGVRNPDSRMKMKMQACSLSDVAADQVSTCNYFYN